MTDNEEVKNGEYDNGEKCPEYCDFCDWLGSWKNCTVLKCLKEKTHENK